MHYLLGMLVSRLAVLAMLASMAACGARAAPARKAAAASAPAGGSADSFGFDLASSVDAMRLAKIEGTTVWLGMSSRKFPATAPREVDSVLDAAAGAPGAGVVDDELPPGDPLRAVEGVAVNVLDASFEVMCEGRLHAPRLRYASFVEPAQSGELAAALIAEGSPVILATLTAPCTGAYVSGLHATALAALDGRGDVIPDAALEELHTWNEADDVYGSITQLVTGDRGFLHVQIDMSDRCDRSESHSWALYRASRSAAGWSYEQVAEGNGNDSLDRLTDLDGDGQLDLLTERGAFAGASFQLWKPDLRLFWPPGLGCDGYDG